MGNAPSITWNANQDAVAGTGKVILSDPIEGIDAGKFFDMMEDFVQTRPLNTALFEAKREVKPMADGGLHEAVDIEVTGVAAMVAGDIKIQLHNVYKFSKDKGEMTFTYFHNDATLKEPSTMTTFKALSSPFRLEVGVEEFETRKAGPVLQGLAANMVKSLGYDVAVEAEAPSVAEPGQKSVLSGPLPGATTCKEFWEKMSAQLESDNGTALPDGSVVVETSGFMGATESTYYKYCFDEGGDTIVCEDYGTDEQMEEVRILSFWKLVDGNRLEVWAKTRAGRRCGEGPKKVVEALVTTAMKHAAEKQG